MNAMGHCQGCHERLGQHPIEMAERAKRVLGNDRLQVLANKATKLSKFEKEIIHKYYLGEKKRLLRLRAEGVTGWIEFTMVGI